MTTPFEEIDAIEAIGAVEGINPVSFTETASTAGIRSAESSRSTASTSVQTKTHTQLNVSILQASVDVSLSSGNDSLALLFQSAIAGINDILEPEFGKNAIQNAASPDLSQDNGPDGTAGRIVSLSTGFYEAFKQQHVGEPAADVLKQYMATIGSGFEQGYQEARDILQGMKVLNGDIASGIDKTHELVLKGYADFAAAHASD